MEYLFLQTSEISLNEYISLFGIIMLKQYVCVKQSYTVRENENIRVIFGMKLKQLRQTKGLSLLELSGKSGLSLSYINEIEKGKKYPKADKIIALAKGLDVNYDHLVSLKVNKSLAPAVDVLNSSLMKEFPLEIFGIESKKLIELISNAPAKVNAFINALVEIANNYNLKNENFYFAALRSYQVLHENYFEDLEEAADRFLKQFDLKEAVLSEGRLTTILQQHYHYEIRNAFPEKYPQLKKFRCVVVDGKPKVIYLNQALNEEQRMFQLAREAGYNFLGIKDRPFTSTWIKVHSFEQVLNNFKASYFANAVLIKRESLLNDVEALFQKTKWNNKSFEALLVKYHVSPETLLHRLTNLLPKYWNIHNLFFLRVNKTPKGFFIDKELHIATKHRTYSNEVNMHYCRRWLAISMLQPKSKQQSGIQYSHYIDSGQHYLIITLKVPGHKMRKTDTSYSLGLMVNNDLKRKAGFLNDQHIPEVDVNMCCEKCALTDCKERVAPPSELHHTQELDKLENVLKDFMKTQQ